MPLSENKILQAALDYAGRGWKVFPIHNPLKEGGCSCGNPDCESPAKHPRTPHGLKDATTNKAVISEWWKKWPEANVGVVTGKDSGLLVLDIDLQKEGVQESKKKLEQKGNLPYTPQVRTGGGGEHIFMTYPDNGTIYGNKANLGGLIGIDVRGEGGYVVAHPSKHISGKKYVWAINHLGTKISAVPPWLLSMLQEKPVQAPGAWRATGGNSYWAKLWEGIATPGRNDAASKLAGRLLGRGMPVEEVEIVLSLWNSFNTPPLSHEELVRTIKSINRSEESKPTAGAIVSAQWLLEQPQEEIKEIITKGILPEGAGLILTGEGGSGKSLLSLEMALRISKGMPIWDFEVPEAKRVLIIQSENPLGQMKRRLNNIARGLKISDVSGISIVEPEFRADINQERDRRKIKDRIEKTQAKVILLDPLVSYHSSNENDNVQMRRTLDHLTQIASEMNVSWIVIHHDAKPGEFKKGNKYSFRGASSIRDWARTMIGLEIKGNNSGRTLRVLNFNKINFGPDQTPIILERNIYWVHEITEDATVSVVVECLLSMGGFSKGKLPLVKEIMKFVGCSQRKAYQAVDEAMGKGIDIHGETIVLTTKF